MTAPLDNPTGYPQPRRAGTYWRRRLVWKAGAPGDPVWVWRAAMVYTDRRSAELYTDGYPLAEVEFGWGPRIEPPPEPRSPEQLTLGAAT